MKSSLEYKIKELCHRYNNESEQKEIERKIFDCFYEHSDSLGNRNYEQLSDILSNNKVPALATKARNVHFAIKATQLLKTIESRFEKYLINKKNLMELLASHPTKENYEHYINTQETLIKQSTLTEDPHTIQSLLNNIDWTSKENLYTNSIERIVKFDLKKTKTSIIIISNGEESYILEALEAIAKQVKQHDCKIIFVSNNKLNQTKKIISKTNTFIQLSRNTGAYLARNIGAVFAGSDLLIFMEDDGVPAEYFVASHEKAHNESNIITARGCYLNKSKGEMPEHYWLGMHKMNSAPNLEGNCSIKSKDFYKIGGWGDYILFGHGGYDLCHRLLTSYSTPNQHIYIPSAILFHDWKKQEGQMEIKTLKQHASWHILKSRNGDIVTIKKAFN